MHIYQLLSELRDDLAPEKLEETIAYIRYELIHEVIEGEADGVTLQILLNDQEEAFFEALAAAFVADLNSQPFAYFSLWEHVLAYFDRRSIQLFYASAVQQAGRTEAYAYCYGLWELENEQPAEAIAHFYNVTNELRHYGIGLCYQAVGSFKNAIKHHYRFLEPLLDPYRPADKEQQYKMAEWHSYKESAYCDYQLGAWKDAESSFFMVFGHVPIPDLYILSTGRTGKKAALFHTLTAQYLQVLERAKDYEMAMEVIGFALDYFPADAYYKRVEQRLKEVMAGHDFAGHLLSGVFQPALPTFLQHPHPAPGIEKSIVQWIVSRLKANKKLFKKHLHIYDSREIYGQQLYVAGAGCFIDLLLEDYEAGIVYAVACSSSATGASTLYQLEHCCEVLAEELNREVKGILCLYDTGSIKSECVIALDNIEVFKMRQSFSQLPSKQ